MRPSIIILLALFQPGRAAGRSGFTQWLVEFLIQPQFQDNPAAGQVATTVFWATGLAAVVVSVFAFLSKLFWEKRVRRYGAQYAAFGPSRTRWMLLVWFFVFLLGYLILMFGIVTRPLALVGAGNLVKMAAIGSLFYVLLFLAFHLLSEDYRQHLPWKKVR